MLNRVGLSSKVAISQTMAEKVILNGKVDVLGSPMDKCARVEKIVKPNQILTDRDIFESCRSFLKDYDDTEFKKYSWKKLKEFGFNNLYELK